MRLIFMFLFILSCVHSAVRPISSRGELLFPLGNYQHDVKIEIETGEHKEFHFEGIIQYSKEQIKMTGLSPLGMSLFRVTENLKTGEVKTEIFMTSLEKFKNRFSEYYKIIRNIFGAKLYSDTPGFYVLSRLPSGLPENVEIKNDGKTHKLKIISYDSNQIPANFSIESERFNIKIHLEEFNEVK